MNKQSLQELAKYKVLIDADITEYSQELAERWQLELGWETTQVLGSYLSVLSRGGKRLRGSLCMWAYGLAGGDDEALALRLARVLEMIHAYLLVVDDVDDQSEMRRGGQTAHILLEKYHHGAKWFGNSKHFSQMQAINAGLAAQHAVMQEITELTAPDSTKLEAVRELNAILFKTVAGQIADINHQAIREVSEHEVINMMQQKTTFYSFVSPLQLGVIMAGKDWSQYAWLEQWAVNIGLSFQITDDIIGVFGDEKISGKSNLSDIKEGKITLLVARALEQSQPEQKEQLLQYLGNKNLTQSDLEQVQAVLEDSGAMTYSRRLAEDYAQRAIQNLKQAPIELKDRLELLKSLPGFIIQRQN